MDRLELQKLRDLPIEEVAGRLGLRVTRHKALCPFHADHHPSLSFDARRNTFRCFVCDAHGGVIDLVMRCLNTDFKEAVRWLSEGEAPPPQAPMGAAGQTSRQSAADTRRTAFSASRYEPYFQNPTLSETARHFLFDERKLDPRVVRWCQLSSWQDRQGAEWLQIPYRDADGRLVGIQSRRLKGGGDTPRFRFPQGSICSIYNLPVLARLKEHDELWITEGCSDCWAMLSSGRRAIAIPSATLLSPQDKELLRLLCALTDNGGLSFHMYPDQDLPGERLFLQLRDIIPSLQHHQLPKGCKDFSDLYVQRKR